MAITQEESHVENKHERCNTDEKMGMSTRKINHECTRIYTNALHMGIKPWGGWRHSFQFGRYAPLKFPVASRTARGFLETTKDAKKEQHVEN